MPEYYSASQLKKFLRCPKAYSLEYVEDYDLPDPAAIPLRKGSRVHEAIEQGINQPRMEDESWEDVLLSTYHGLSKHPLPDGAFGEGIDCIETAARYLDKRDPEVQGVEEEFEFRTSWKGFEGNFRGYIDLAADGEIWDWKTGKIREGEKQRERIQGAVYMGGYRNLYGVNPEAVRFVYLGEEEVRSVAPADKTWDIMISEADRLEKAWEGGEFEPDPGKICRHCEYSAACPAKKASVEGVPYDEY